MAAAGEHLRRRGDHLFRGRDARARVLDDEAFGDIDPLGRADPWFTGSVQLYSHQVLFLVFTGWLTDTAGPPVRARGPAPFLRCSPSPGSADSTAVDLILAKTHGHLTSYWECRAERCSGVAQRFE